MRFTQNILMAVLAILALTFVGCNENEDPLSPNPTVRPNPVTGLMANSRDSSSVGLMWTRPATGTYSSYRINVFDGTNRINTFNINGNTVTSAVVTGLPYGKAYRFDVHTVQGDSVSNPTSITWAPAKRTVSTVRMYSSRSSQGSGIQIFGTPTPRNLSISSGENWDLCFDDRTQDVFSIGSPASSSYTDANGNFPSGPARRIDIGRDYVGVVSLDELYESKDLSADSPFGEKLLTLNTISDQSRGYAFVVRYRPGGPNSTNFFWAKVLVKSVNGSFVQGSGNDRFVECEISYQSVLDLPYGLFSPVGYTGSAK